MPTKREFRVSFPIEEATAIETLATQQGVHPSEVIRNTYREAITQQAACEKGGEISFSLEAILQAQLQPIMNFLSKLDAQQTVDSIPSTQLQPVAEAVPQTKALPQKPELRVVEQRLSKPSLGAISRLIQGHLIKPVNNITAQQTQHYLSELDRWFVLKAEMEILYTLIAALVMALAPEADLPSWQAYLAHIEQMREALESKVPPLPEHFQSLKSNDVP